MLEHSDRFDATLVTFGDGPLAQRARGAGIRVVTTEAPFSFLRLPKAFLHVRRAARSLRPDVIVANSMIGAGLGIVVPRSRGTRVMMLRDLVRGGYFGAIARAVISRLIIPSYAMVIANSDATAASIPPAARRRTVVEVASPVSGVSKVSAPRERTTASGPLRVLSLSRLQRWKGIHDLVEAAGLAAQEIGAARLSLTVAGGSVMADGGYEQSLVSRAGELGIEADFPGHVSDVAGLLAAHDVVVVASEIPEPFGQVVPQALAAALPVIATAHGGPAAVLADSEAGRLVPPSDPAAMAAALVSLAEDPGSWTRASAAASRLAQQYTDQSTVERWESLLVGAHARGGRK